MIPTLRFKEEEVKEIFLRSVSTHRNHVYIKWTRDNTNLLLLLLVKQHKSWFGSDNTIFQTGL